ncbi:MAG: cupin domain-containing protein [Flavobacteriaceae bacterium]|nr:cupin domain-containing protein [Flavobacteriaceae bacterium]NNL31711.1 cupin domain-containing protein [Flavobacteriaceae bacterium]
MKRSEFLKIGGVASAALLAMPLSAASKVRSILNKIKPKIVRKDEGQLWNVIGDLQLHKISGADTNDQIVEWVNEVAPGVGIPPHVHTKEDEIFRVLKGKVELMVGGESTILEAGDVAFAPKNVVHSWKIVGTESASMCTSAFPAGIEHMFAELGKLPPGPPDFPKVAEICGRYGISFV